MKTNKTKEKILDTSIRMFNEKKASNVSTVQISADMKISPGNLYYYYSNKEEVIRCIWNERMTKEIEELLDRYENAETAGELMDFFIKTIGHCMKYSFFYTEMSTLFVNDRALMEIYSDVEKRIKKETILTYKAMIARGKAESASDEEIEIIADNGLALMVSLASYCDLAEKGASIEEIEKIICKRMAAYMKPYLTDEMKKELQDALEARGAA